MMFPKPNQVFLGKVLCCQPQTYLSLSNSRPGTVLKKPGCIGKGHIAKGSSGKIKQGSASPVRQNFTLWEVTMAAAKR